MIYCFDTSAINSLLDDPEQEPMVKALLSVGSFRITAYNVLEVAKTNDTNRCSRLMNLMKQMANGKRPLDRPNTILLTYADAHAAQASAASVNTDKNLDGLWVALQRPDLIDQEARNEVIAWSKKVEDDFSTARDRDQYQAFFRDEPQERPKTTAQTLRKFLSKKEEFRSLISDVYKRQTGKQLTDSKFKILVQEPSWVLYYLGYVYAFHHSVIQEHNFSARRNTGAIDLFQAVYLTLCDHFVTSDRAQHRGLRLLNVMNTQRHTQVTLYKTFRSRLLMST